MGNTFTPIPWASGKVPGDEEGGYAKTRSPSVWFSTVVMLLGYSVRVLGLAAAITALLICAQEGWKPKINDIGKLWLLFSTQEMPRLPAGERRGNICTGS